MIQSRDFTRHYPQDPKQKQEAKQRRLANMMEAVRAAPRSARGVIERVIGGAAPIVKEDASQSGPYMIAAKALGYCMRCGVQVAPLTGLLDFCHADLGKGQGIKTDVRLGWPGCRKCHEVVGRELPKTTRRAVEWLLGVMTRAAVLEAGTWPKRLAKWGSA